MLSYPYILFIDTETSGKPTAWDAPPTEQDKWPHIVQVAWIITDKEGSQIASRDFIIEASDYSIRKKAQKIHGISEEIANQLGVTRKEALKALYKDLKRYKPLIVGHFITLDLRMLQAGFGRAGIKNIVRDYPAFCTMRSTSDYMHMKNRNYPLLGELYQMLFRKKMTGEHNAAGDAQAVSECFFELVNRGEVDDLAIRKLSRELKISSKKSGNKGCGLPVFIVILLVFISSFLL